MRIYQVYIIRTFKEREKILSFPIRGESEEDVKKYVEEEFLSSIKRGKLLYVMEIFMQLMKLIK